MSYPEYYKILQIEPDASQDEIKQAYHKLAKKLHPDLHKNDKKSEEKLKKVNEAYNVLKDISKRAEYDYFGKQAQEAERQSREQTQDGKPDCKQSQPDTIVINKRHISWYYFLFNKMILLSILAAYGWLLYINVDKNEPYNIAKTLINTADYLRKEIPDKIMSGAKMLHNGYQNSIIQEKLTFYLIKTGKTDLVRTFMPLLNINAFDTSDNMHSVLMSSPNSEMTKYLLSKKPDVSYVAKDGNTALSEAINREDIDSVFLLLGAGATAEDLSEKDLHKLLSNKKIIDLFGDRKVYLSNKNNVNTSGQNRLKN